MVKKIFWAAIAVLLLVIVGLYWAIQVKSRVAKDIHAFVSAAQKDVPRFIDEFTYLENVLAEGKAIYFNYLIAGEGVEVEGRQQELEHVFNLAMCETTYRKTLLENNVIVVFRYKNDKDQVREYTFSLKDCQEPAKQ